jgi:hypothetical protein
VRVADRVPAGLAAAPAARLLPLWHGGLAWAVAAARVCEVVGTERLQRNPRPTAGWPYGWLLGEREEVPVFLPGAAGLAAGEKGIGAVVVLQPAAGPRCGLAVATTEEVREEPISRLRLLPAAAAGCRWAFPRVILWDEGLALEIAPEAVPRLAAILGGMEAPPAGETVPPAVGAPAPGLAPLGTSVPAGLFVFALPGFGALHFALPAAQVVEVLSSPASRPVPGAPELLLGLCAWHGEPLPLLDLARAIGLPSTAASGNGCGHALVARAAHSRQLLAFPVASLVGMRQGPFPQPVSATCPFPGAHRVLGAFADGDQVLAVPDLDGALRTFPAEPVAAAAASGGR